MKIFSIRPRDYGDAVGALTLKGFSVGRRKRVRSLPPKGRAVNAWQLRGRPRQGAESGARTRPKTRKPPNRPSRAMVVRPNDPLKRIDDEI